MSGDAPSLAQIRQMLEARAQLARTRDPHGAAQLGRAIDRVRHGPAGTTLPETAPSLAADADADLLREGELILALLAIADRDYPLQARTLEARVAELLTGPGGVAPEAA
jgi:hypothetical protein